MKINPNAILMREAVERVVGLLTASRIKVTMRGAGAYVQYNAKGAIELVNLPSIPDDASDEFLAAVQGFLDHEVGHVLFSEPKIAAVYSKLPPRVESLADVIEDVFIEKMMAKTYAGSEFNLGAVRQFFIDRVVGPKAKELLKAGDTKQLQGWLIVQQMRAWGGQRVCKDWLAANPALVAHIKDFNDMVGDLADQVTLVNSTQDGLHLAQRMVARIEEAERKKREEEKAKREKAEKKSEPKPKPEKEEGEPEKKSEPKPKPEKKEDEPKPKKEGGEPEPAPSETPGEGDDSPNPGEGDPDPDMDDGDGDGGPEPKEEPAPEPKKPEAKKPEPEPKKPEAEAPKAEEGTAAKSGVSTADEDGEAAEAGGRGKEGEGEADGGEDDDEAEGAGGSALSSLDSDPAALSFDKAMAAKLSELGAKELAASEYAIPTRDLDVVEPGRQCINPKALEALDDLGPMVGQITKQLERALAARSRVGFNPGMRRGRINAPALHRVASGDDRIFRQRYEIQSKATAVSLLVDCSGSMGGRRIALAGKAAFAMSSALERLRIKHEVLGFTTKDSGGFKTAMKGSSGIRWARGHALYMPVFKGFDQRLDLDSRQRMAELVNDPRWLHENVDGECVMIAARRLAAVPNVERRILIVLSDGQPLCPPEPYILRKHLAQVVKQVEKEMSVVGIGIESSAVKDYYSKSIVLNDLAELPATVMKQLSELLLKD